MSYAGTFILAYAGYADAILCWCFILAYSDSNTEGLSESPRAYQLTSASTARPTSSPRVGFPSIIFADMETSDGLRPKRSASVLAGVSVVLCGDLGGTNSRLELFRVEDPSGLDASALHQVGKTQPLSKCTYKNDNIEGDFTDLLHRFLRDSNLPLFELVAGCLAVAGPVSKDRVVFTNLCWVIDARSLEDEFEMPRGSMRLVNDFAANGYGVVTLEASDYDEISPHGPIVPTVGAPVACVGAGTGLGETFATSSETSGGLIYDAWPSEGGHVAFAPRDDLQCELLLHLMGKFHGRVSTERVVSGKGIVNVYEFLATKFPDEVDATIDAKIRFETEGAMYVSRSSYDNALCERVITLVLDAYGAELGNAAVKWLPFGGLYIAGGIAIKNLDRIRDPDSPFMRAYLDRGRLKTVLDKIPLREPPPKYHPFLHPYPSIPPSILPSFLR